MSEPLYKVVFRGEIGFDFEEEEVKANLQKFSGFSREKIDRLFSGATHVLKKDTEQDAANRFRDALMRMGAMAEVEPMQAPRPVTLQRPRPAPQRRQAVFKCPACGQEQEQGQTCVACGIFFAKYEAAQKRKAQALQESLLGVAPPAEDTGAVKGLIATRFDLRAAVGLQATGVALVVAALQCYFFGRHLEGIGFIILATVFLLGLLFSSVFSGGDLFDGIGENLSLSLEPYLRVERRQHWWPYKVTYAAVLLLILLHYGLVIHLEPATLVDHLAVLPARPTPWGVPLGLLGATFLTVSGWQLWGGVLFLWALGVVLEPRLGSLRFAFCLVGLGLVGGVLGSFAHLLLFNQLLHGFGPAGALAGLLGLCVAAECGPVLTFTLPFIGALPLVYPLGFEVRFNLLALIGFFFYAALAGGYGAQHTFQAALGLQLVNLAGFFCGLLLGHLLPARMLHDPQEKARRRG